MNKILNYILLLVLLLANSACYEDFLEIVPQDNLVTDSFFRNDAEIRAGTAALYGMPWFDYNDKFSWVAGDAMPGNLYHTWDQEGQFFFFSFNEGNAHLTRGWQSLFRVVSYSNSIINDLPELQVDKYLRHRLIGSCGSKVCQGFCILHSCGVLG